MTTQPTQYILTTSDSLTSLADRAYGDFTNFRELAEVNDIDIFEQLPIGKAITLPTRAEVKALAAEAIAAAAQTVADSIAAELDLSGLKQPETGNPFQLISWVI